MLTHSIRAQLSPLANIFANHGYSIYLVGGAVRDLLLGKTPTDFDLTTDALPQDTMKLFKNVIPTGLQHGTVTVRWAKMSYEVTTFRIDGEYVDHRRPESIVFTSSLEKDLERRDFTINAMAIDLLSGQLIDFHQGQEDIKLGIIKAIGNPEHRFKEDALRMLRACRFVSKLNFKLDLSTFEAISKLAPLLSKVSIERIRIELDKLLQGQSPITGLQLFEDTGLFQVLRKEILDLYQFPLDWSHLETKDLCKVEIQTIRAHFYAQATYGRTKEPILVEKLGKVLNQMKYSNHDSNEIKKLAEIYCNFDSPFTLYGFKKALEYWGDRNWKIIWDYFYMNSDEELDENIKDVWKSWIQHPIFLGDLKINGRDLMNLGYEGKEVGKLLKIIQKEIWKFPLKNEKECWMNTELLSKFLKSQ